MGYDLEAWGDFWVAMAGASAALTGLLVVAVSINLDRILHLPLLPLRAAETLGLITALLVASMIGLAPVGRTALAAAFVVIGLLMGGVDLWRRLRPLPTGVDPGVNRLGPMALVLSTALPLVVGGVSLLAGAGGGLYWILAAFVIGYLSAVLNAWVLLVEILR